jgi:DNA-binding NtrC family response regulator
MDVLLFDSEINQLLMMEETLKRIGCKVTPVKKEIECFAKLINGRYDLVIFDHEIPGLDVTGFVSQVEKIDQCLSVAMMVTMPSRFYEDKYGCSGIDFLIFKPFGYDEVLLLLRNAFQYSLKLRKAS